MPQHWRYGMKFSRAIPRSNEMNYMKPGSWTRTHAHWYSFNAHRTHRHTKPLVTMPHIGRKLCEKSVAHWISGAFGFGFLSDRLPIGFSICACVCVCVLSDHGMEMLGVHSWRMTGRRYTINILFPMYVDAKTMYVHSCIRIHIGCEWHERSRIHRIGGRHNKRARNMDRTDMKMLLLLWYERHSLDERGNKWNASAAAASLPRMRLYISHVLYDV